MSPLSLAELLQVFPYSGELMWIGLRPGKGEPMLKVDEVLVDTQSGLIGDRYQGNSGRRQVTLLQYEHLAVLESMLGKVIPPEVLRRNLLIKGVNLLALKNCQFKMGTAVFQMTGLCHPCSKMETKLGPGGYNAMRGHGGINAQVLQGGKISVGDKLIVLNE